MTKDKAYVCNHCRKVITFALSDAGRMIACPFCKTPARLPVAFGASAVRKPKLRAGLICLASGLLAIIGIGAVLLCRKAAGAGNGAQQPQPVWNLLSEPRPTLAPTPVHAKGQRATLAVTEVVYGCPDIYQEALGRTSATETAVCCVKIVVTNTGKKAIPFRSWRIFTALADAQQAVLTNPDGEIYNLTAYGVDCYPVGCRRQSELAPQESLTDQVLFLCGTKPDCDLQLRLPCENIGGKGNLFFTIPRNLIR